MLFRSERGIHYKFEGQFVEENISPEEVVALAGKLPPVGDLMADYVAYLRYSLGLVRRLYELDKAGAFTARGTPEGRRFVIERLAAGRDMLAAVWLAAWRQSQWEGCVPFTEAPSRTSQVGCLVGTVVAISEGRAASAPGAGAASSAPTSTAVAASEGTSGAGRPGSLYLNLCEDFRNCALSVQIPAAARPGFPDPETLRGKSLRFFGLVSTIGGRPVMLLSDPRQLRP